MSKIITLFKRHYIGTAAEIAGITGVCGDTAYSTDTDVYYHWEGAAWLAGGIPYFVERLINVPDKQIGDFTTDGNLHVDGLDLSGIVPAGAFSVLLRVFLKDDAAGSYLNIIRDAAHSNNAIEVRVHVANLGNTKVEQVSIDSNRFLDYQTNNVVFLNIDVTVLGWWIRECL